MASAAACDFVVLIGVPAADMPACLLVGCHRCGDGLASISTAAAMQPTGRVAAANSARLDLAMHSSYRKRAIKLLDIWQCRQARSFPAARTDDAGQTGGVQAGAHHIQATLGRTRQ